MRKFFLLFVIGTLTISCSSDDSTKSETEKDKFIGEWKLTSYKSGFIGQETDEFVQGCSDLEKLKFTTNTVVITESSYDESTGVCETYTLSPYNWDINEGAKQLIISAAEEGSVTSSYEFVSNNSLKLVFYDGDNYRTISTYSKN